MNTYYLKDVSFAYGNSPLLENIELQIAPNSFIGLLGPNGSGKTTLLKLLSGALTPQRGEVIFYNQNLASFDPNKRAQLIGVVPQESNWEFPFSLEEIVAMGRYPHLGWWGNLSSIDRQKVEEALAITGLKNLRYREITNLSGGEKQRAVIARALAQDTKVMLLDEPVSNLDLKYQQEVFELLAYLHQEKGLTIIVISHDLNLAAQYAEQLILLDQGKIRGCGNPKQVLQSALIEEVYGVPVQITDNPITNSLQVNLLRYTKKTSEITNGIHVHLIGGGGSLESVIYELNRQGYQLSLGVVNAGDTDAEASRSINIPRVLEAPFSPISTAKKRANEALIQKADVIVLGNMPFGSGNLSNLQQAVQASQQGKKVLRLKGKNITERDYTNGQAAELWVELDKLGSPQLESFELTPYLKGEF